MGNAPPGMGASFDKILQARVIVLGRVPALGSELADKLHRRSGRGLREPPLRIAGDANRCDHCGGSDDESGAGDLFRLTSADEIAPVIATTVGAMNPVPQQCPLQMGCTIACEITHYFPSAGVSLGIPFQ